ncbi:PQ loop repeat-domain-containing protein [Lophiotrema nucula]|uniref:PQ loop repeat-domain-containing protein n=1 Tax=Lophiotrema nucula TaxID=690887 RepID=A0A6A5Z6S7_9PLEO|nr:PQ loop repeat-domain-containing protein [Lophiotrema nucula]
MDVPVAANVLGTMGAVCWSVQLIPQIVINYRRHNTIGLQPTMMMLWASAGVPLGVYNIVENFNVALQIQPQLLTFLSLITWIQCFYYERNWSVPRALVVVTPIACIMGGIQAALIIALRIAKDRGLQWPMTLMAVLSAALLAAGVLRHYWDIYVHRTVRGISFLFIGIDAAGDVFSLVSVLFQPTPDVLGLVIYGTELILWIGVFACGGYYNLAPWIRKRLEKRKSSSSRSMVPCQGSGSGGEEVNPGISTNDPIALHDLSRSTPVYSGSSVPSSTSVFRTPSGELDFARARTAGARSSHDEGNSTE